MIHEENILIEAGLSEEQALVYGTLLERGPQKASALAKWTGIKRGLIYKVLEQLESLGSISKKGGPGTVALFSPNHPSLLMNSLERKEKELALAKEMLTHSLGTLSSKYNLITGKPSVQFYEGILGLEKLYGDIISDKKDFLLIQSPHDRNFPEVAVLIEKQVKLQVEKNIHVKAITPAVQDTKEFVAKYDKTNLVERRIIPTGQLDEPAQIIIFGENVGITSFGNTMITTIIHDQTIAQSFTAMFEYIWQKSTPEHEKIIASFGILNNPEV